MPDGFELDAVARRIEHDHQRFLVGLAGIADLRLHIELGPSCCERLGEPVPLLAEQDEAEMALGELAFHGLTLALGILARDQMGHEMVAEEIEIAGDRIAAAPSLATAEQRAIKGARRRDIEDREGVMEDRPRGVAHLPLPCPAISTARRRGSVRSAPAASAPCAPWSPGSRRLKP